MVLHSKGLCCVCDSLVQRFDGDLETAVGQDSWPCQAQTDCSRHASQPDLRDDKTAEENQRNSLQESKLSQPSCCCPWKWIVLCYNEWRLHFHIWYLLQSDMKLTFISVAIVVLHNNVQHSLKFCVWRNPVVKYCVHTYTHTHTHSHTQLIEVAQRMNSEILESIKETSTVSQLYCMLISRTIHCTPSRMLAVFRSRMGSWLSHVAHAIWACTCTWFAVQTYNYFTELFTAQSQISFKSFLPFSLYRLMNGFNLYMSSG